MVTICAPVIVPLAAQAVVPTAAAWNAAEQLGLSTRSVYELIRRYRASGGFLGALAPSPIRVGEAVRGWRSRSNRSLSRRFRRCI